MKRFLVANTNLPLLLAATLVIGGVLLPRPCNGATPADPPARAKRQGSSLYNPNESYDVKQPVYPVTYSEEQKKAQRAAGIALVKEVKEAARSGKADYRAQPGVYRLPKGADFEFGGAGDFALHLPDCELVLESAEGRCLFKFGKAKSFTLTGPLKIDCDPLIESQGRIVASDFAARQMTIEILPSYHALAVGPKDKQLFHAYTPQGVWLPNPAYSEFAWKDAVLAADGRTVTIHAGKDVKRDYWEMLYKPGNLVSVGNAGCGVLFCIWPDQFGELSVQDMDFYGGGFGWGNAIGNSALTRVRGMRRPGTNRLQGGGGWQSGKRQGRVTLDSCEFRTTNDDILDLSSGSMDMVWQQESPRTCVIWTYKGHHYELDPPGSPFVFYRKDFAPIADAQLVTAERIPDDQAKPWVEPAAQLVKSKLDFKAFNDGRAFWRLTFDKDLTVEPGTLMEDVANRQMEVVIRNCTWLDCGMRVMVQSGRKTEITNNHFVRVSAGLHACTDAWWWQGETVHDVLIADNVFIDSPYGNMWNSGKAAISVHNGTKPIADFPGRYPHDNIVIRDNRIEGASSGAIIVQNSDRVQITGNECRNLFQRKEAAAAIAVSGCRRVMVADNRIDNCPAPTIKAKWVDGLDCHGNAASNVGGAAKPAVAIDLAHVRAAQVQGNTAERSTLNGVVRVTDCPDAKLDRNTAGGTPAVPPVITEPDSGAPSKPR